MSDQNKKNNNEKESPAPVTLEILDSIQRENFDFINDFVKRNQMAINGISLFRVMRYDFIQILNHISLKSLLSNMEAEVLVEENQSWKR